VPFPRAQRRRQQHDYETDQVRAAVALSRASLIDPAKLAATQAAVAKPAVEFYLGDRYTMTGDTYQGHLSSRNRLPLIYLRDDSALILAGHHRATAAPIQNRDLEAIVISGGWGDPW
jgi:hypothetical protein